MPGLMIKIKPGKGKPEEAEPSEDGGSFEEAFAALVDAIKSGDMEEGAAAFKACCAMADD